MKHPKALRSSSMAGQDCKLCLSPHQHPLSLQPGVSGTKDVDFCVWQILGGRSHWPQTQLRGLSLLGTAQVSGQPQDRAFGARQLPHGRDMVVPPPRGVARGPIHIEVTSQGLGKKWAV